MKTKYFFILTFLHFISTSFVLSKSFFSVNYTVFKETQNESNKFSHDFINSWKDDLLNSSNQYDEAHNRAVEVVIFKSFSKEIIEAICNSIKNDFLFECYHLYTNQYFLDYICHQPGYSEFILQLHKKIHASVKQIKIASSFIFSYSVFIAMPPPGSEERNITLCLV